MGARRKLNRLAVRIAVSDAAAWTGRRFYGGEYRVVPNGVALPAGGAPAPRVRAPGEPLEIVFVGQAVERKGLPILLRAFEALREHVPARLTIVGASETEVAPLLVDRDGVTVLGRVSDDEKRAALERADVLAAPSLGGESFGMVLTEGFAAGTPVVASDIAGYRDVVRDGVDGAARAARRRHGAGRDAARPRARRRSAPRRSAPPRPRAPSATPGRRSPRRSSGAYDDARAVPQPEGAAERAAVRIGLRSADLGPRRPAQRLPSLEPAPTAARRAGAAAAARRDGRSRRSAPSAAPTSRVEHIGIDRIGHTLVTSSPTWVLVGLALMCASMIFRAVSWHAILKAALPDARPRFTDAWQGTAVGVLMSATLPGAARRAVARADRRAPARAPARGAAGRDRHARLADAAQRARARDPRRGDVLHRRPVRRAASRRSLWYALAPIVVLALVLVAPALVRSGLPRALGARRPLDAPGARGGRRACATA